MRNREHCNRRLLAVALFGLVASIALPALAEDSGVSVVPDAFDATLVPERWNQDTVRLSWSKTPSPTDIIHAFPKGAIYDGAVEWQCGADARGHLKDCELLQTVPTGNGVQRDGLHTVDERYVRAAKQLLPMFELDARSAQAVRIEGNKVEFLVPVARPGAKPVPDPGCSPSCAPPLLPTVGP